MTITKKENRIKRALISVSDKTGVVELARFLQGKGVEIISTGGTKQLLKEAGLRVVPVSSFTGAPEILEGRVKTLHPKIAAGILFRRSSEEDCEQLNSLDYKPIDLVIVNLYPFEEVVARGAAEKEVIENIDIGGPTLIRSAAKNFGDVTVLVDPTQYAPFIDEFEATEGAIPLAQRRRYAAEAFALVQRYDKAINDYFVGTAEVPQPSGWDASSTQPFPETLTISISRKAKLRYGENPHQEAALYDEGDSRHLSLTRAEQLAGKELSYNNYLDLDACLAMLIDFTDPFACVVKHTNPCGAACGATLEEAYRDALAGDPVSAYGSIIGLNRCVDITTARLLHDTQFVECIIAPDFDAEALALLQKKKQRRLLRLPEIGTLSPSTRVLRAVYGGYLCQSADARTVAESDLTVVTKRQPTKDQVRSLLFGFQLVKHVKSNAIVIILDRMLVGLGCGQTSRVDAVENAVKKAGDRAKRAVLASDAFFPMADGVEAAAAAGVTAIIQPGGSKRDDAAIAAADKADIAMVFTGIRHFRH